MAKSKAILLGATSLIAVGLALTPAQSGAVQVVPEVSFDQVQTGDHGTGAVADEGIDALLLAWGHCGHPDDDDDDNDDDDEDDNDDDDDDDA